MKRLLFTILIAAALVGLVFTPASTVMAASGTRSLPPSVAAGGNFDVDINTADYGAFGQVVETLPAGFSYVTGSCTLSEAAAVDVEGQVVTFTLLGEEDTAFTYTVAASSTVGTHTFGGKLKDDNKDESTLGGDTEIIVPATRSMLSSVTSGGNFDVSISTFEYGAFGQVAETLPAGFSYVTGSCTLSEAAAVDVEGPVVKFTLLGETAFSYTVTASSTAGTYIFNGILKDVDKDEYAVGGQTQISVTAPAPSGGGGGGGGGAPIYYTETELFGVEKSYRIDTDGEILETITATSEDGMLTITIPEGTIALDKDGDRLSSLTIDVDPSPPAPPEDCCIISLAFDFGPDGATFDPGITLEYTYDPAELPGGVAEADLVIAFYDAEAGEWVTCDCTCDPEANCITACVCHFTTFAIIGAVTPPPPVAPPPPPEEEEVAPAPPEEEEVAPAPPPPPPPEEEVVPAPAPINWPLIGGIIAAVVVAALLIYFLVVRRRAY